MTQQKYNGLDLEEYRTAEGLSFRQVAEGIGLPDKSQAYRICIGKHRPSPEVENRILQWTGGRVSLYAMLRRRLQWMADHGKLKSINPPAGCDRKENSSHRAPSRPAVTAEAAAEAATGG